MMDVTSRRRRRSGSPIKTILGVAVGGLLSLPIVGTILHFLGQDIPVISDVLPRIGGSNTQVRANTPMPLDNFEPRIVEDDMQANEPVTGRSIGEELSDETAGDTTPDPAASALEEITGAPVMAADAGNQTDSFTPPADDSFGSESTAIEDIGAGEMVDPIASGDPVGADPADTATDELGLPDSFSPEPPVAESADSPSGFDLPGAGSDSDDLFGDSSAIEEMSSEDVAADPADMSLPTLPETPAFDVTAEVAQVSSTLDAIYQMDANDPQRNEQIQNAYESLSRLAGEVPADSVSQLQPVLRDLASNVGVVVAFAKTSPEWIAKSSEERGGDGALVVGKMSGGPGAETFLLSNKQEVPVTLPPNTDSSPSGIQIGLGQVQGSGRNATLSLDLLQGVSQ
ncbi:serine repeat-containing antigen [Rhodopirellula sallentina SM41]|uniref:Serine repeat-containing antigen n=2 Tax=Rhodopirellula TaxID=265488 RepID=M5U3N7_9BACT|nr:serine repeat-containing antigen [Rhodopirellula sallentina SM41]